MTFTPGTGKLAGTPAAGTTGSYPLTITAQNGVTPNATQSFTLTVNAASVAPAITSVNNTTFTVGTAGSFTVQTATGSPTPTLSETGTLPSGVTFTPGTGKLAGTPAAGTTGSYPLTITAQNGVAPNATQSFTLTVKSPPPITFTTTSLPGGTVGTAYSANIVVSGGVAPYTITVPLNLPAGLSIGASGAITGTPTTAGTYSPTFTANDSASDAPATAGFALAVSPAAASTSLSFWTTATVPATTAGSDSASVEVGIQFSASVAGHVLGARIYCATNSSGTHTVHLWNTQKQSLAIATMPACSGWTTVQFASPVAVAAKTTYVLSYHTTEYPENTEFFTSALTVGGSTASLTAPKSAGVYSREQFRVSK